VITRHGKRAAVILSFAEWERLSLCCPLGNCSLRRLFLSVVSVVEIKDDIAKANREGAIRKARDLSAWLETLLHLSDFAHGKGQAPGRERTAPKTSLQPPVMTTAEDIIHESRYLITPRRGRPEAGCVRGWLQQRTARNC